MFAETASYTEVDSTGMDEDVREGAGLWIGTDAAERTREARGEMKGGIDVSTRGV